MKDIFRGLVTGPSYNVVSTGNGPTTAPSVVESIRKRSTTVISRLFRERGPNISSERRRTTRSFVLLLIGLITIATGCFLLVLKPYDIIFRWKLLFAEGGETYELWRKPPVDLYLKVMLFNVTNAEAFLAGLEPLNVQEVGPYVYKEDLEHSNVTFNPNGTLSMIPKHPLIWVPEMSNGTEEDMFVLPNIALLSIAQLVRNKPFYTRMGLNLLISQTDSNPLVRMTAREFMFGYQTTFVTLGNKFLNSWIPFDKLGLIDRMYDFEGDYSTVFTGETDIRLGGLIDKYNGNEHLPQWKGEHCSRVSGASDATKFLSFIEPEDELKFFRKSVCRTMTLVYNGSSSVHGLRANHYVFEENALDNGKHNPENKCFCRDGKCLASGLIDVTDCYYGFPIAVSYPHFLEGETSLVEGVTGISPDPAKHRTSLKIGPDSGLPLEVSVKFQINLALDDITSINRVGSFSNLVLPMLWIEIAMAELPSDLQTYFIFLLEVIPMSMTVGTYLLFAVGCSLLVYSIARSLINKIKKHRQQPVRSNSAQQRRASKYVDQDFKNAKEMDLYYCSLLSNARESDIV